MTDRAATRRRETLRQGTPVFIATGPDEIAFFYGFLLDAAGAADRMAEEALERYREERRRNQP